MEIRYVLALENCPSKCLGAKTSNRWPADFAAPRAGKRRFPALSKLFTLAGKHLKVGLALAAPRA